MDKVYKIVNHPLSKSVMAGIMGVIFLLESHSFYAGICFGVGLRELLLAFKAE